MVSSALDASNPKHITFITYLLKEKSKYLAKYRFIAAVRNIFCVFMGLLKPLSSYHEF
jgi:hypothetical protein